MADSNNNNGNMADSNNNNGNNNSGTNGRPMRIGIGGQEGPMLIAQVPFDEGPRYLGGISDLRYKYIKTVHGEGVPAPQLENKAWVRAAVHWYQGATAFQEEFGEHNLPCDINDAIVELRNTLPADTLP